MYNYIFNVAKAEDGNDITELEISKLLNKTVYKKEWNEFSENPLESVEIITNINKASNGYSFALSIDDASQYLANHFAEWTRLVQTTTKEDFFESGSSKIDYINSLYRNDRGDIFITNVDGHLCSGSFEDFLREQIRVCKNQDLNEITLCAKQVFVLHS